MRVDVQMQIFVYFTTLRVWLVILWRICHGEVGGLGEYLLPFCGYY